MRLRIVIILVLCCFGIAPIALLMGINAPAVFGRLEQAAQQESLSRLQNEQYALNVRVERLKERIASLASLPGAGDVLGMQSDHAINAQVAGKRLAALVNKWFGRRAEVLDVTLFDASGRERFRLVRKAKGGPFVVAAGGLAGHPATDFCRSGLTLPAATVRVGGIEVMHPAADNDAAHGYSLSLVTSVAAGSGESIGSLCCRINMTDFLREYARGYWLDGGGNPLHGHEAATEGEGRGISTDAGPEEFAGLKALLAGNKAVVWSGEHGRQVAWQPILFNENMAATLWVGHAVDRIALAQWLESQQLRVFAVVAALMLVVVLLAGKIAAFVDQSKNEVLAGFDAILSGEKPKPFAWGYLQELRQMAGDLNDLADRYFDMRLARQRAEDELRESNAKLEEMVERRTAELFATNEQLSEEVEERSRAEDELISHRDHLEDLVRQRLVELAESNEQLQLEMVRRKHAQDSVRQNEARLRTILDSVPIGIFIVDREKRTIAYANPAAAGMIGADSPADLFGKTCHSLFCESDREQRRCIDAEEYYEQADITLRRLDDVPMSVLKTVIPLTLGDRPCLLESITDITELKRMASQNQTLHQQLLQSQKMEAVGVLAGGVAHDFNNLLTIIQGSAELALLTSSTEKAEHRYLNQIKETTERAGNLVRQLLLFSRTQPMTLSVLHLNDVVENLMKMLKRLIGEDIEVATELADGLWPVKGNAANIEQVVMNLAVNGRDAMASGGKLRIRTRNVVIDERDAVLPEVTPGRFVCLEVVDSGAGIADEVLQHIFEPFFTTKEAGKGTGLGLAVVYGIVKQHEGWIDVDSKAGGGTSFRIYLPGSADAAEKEVAAAPAVDLHGDGRRVLVVEDEETLRGLIADTLVQKGFTVLQATSVDEALAIFAREEGAFDLLFSDVVLPGEQNGIQLADALREKRSDLPVILSSGYTDQKSQWEIITERGYAFLQKPFNIGTLVRMVHDAVKGRGASE